MQAFASASVSRCIELHYAQLVTAQGMGAERLSVKRSAPSGHMYFNHWCHVYCVEWNSARYAAGGAAYLFYLSRKLAAAVAGVTALLWIVALCYGNFTRKAQRTYQDALAETNQACL